MTFNRNLFKNILYLIVVIFILCSLVYVPKEKPITAKTTEIAYDFWFNDSFTIYKKIPYVEPKTNSEKILAKYNPEKQDRIIEKTMHYKKTRYDLIMMNIAIFSSIIGVIYFSTNLFLSIRKQ